MDRIMARSTFCVDGLIELHTNHICALVFEKLHWLIHRAPDADDFTYAENGQVWQQFTYARLFKFFEVEKPDGKTANILGENERTLRRAIKELIEAGLVVSRRCQRGIALAINHKTLRRLVGKDNYGRYGSDLQKLSNQTLENNPDLQDLSTQNPSRLTTVVQSDLQDLSTQPIYKELDSLKDSQKIKDLSGAIASDDLNAAIVDLVKVSDLNLTGNQKTVLMQWIVRTTNLSQDFITPADVGIEGKALTTLKALVKKGVLALQGEAISRQMTAIEEPKSILMNLTYAELGVEPPVPRNTKSIPSKPADKPFWELCAAMHCWNDLNMTWRKYLQFADSDAVALLNKKIKQTCLALESIHEKEPISVVELQSFVAWWHEERFSQSMPVTERMFPTTQDKLRDHFIEYRVKYRADQHTLEVAHEHTE